MTSVVSPKFKMIFRVLGVYGAVWLCRCLRLESNLLVSLGRELVGGLEAIQVPASGDADASRAQSPLQSAPNATKGKVKLGTPVWEEQSSKNATVLGMAANYELLSFKKFVGSLRASGFEGKIILVVSPKLNQQAEDYLIRNNVTMRPLRPVNCTTAPAFLLRKKSQNALKDHQEEERITCGHPYPELKLRWGRFALLRDYLQECAECTGPVLITDVRDTFFQRDPFGPHAPPVTGLQIFQEDPQQSTLHWLTKGPITRCKNIAMFDEIMLCSGTTIGTREAMLQYLQMMVDEMREWLKNPNCNLPGNGDDQAIHNYLFYTGAFSAIPNTSSIPNGQGLVHTVGTFGSQALKSKRSHLSQTLNISQPAAQMAPYTTTQEEEENGNWWGSDWIHNITATYPLTDRHGYFINSNGERSFVVHQYDRFGSPLERWLFRSGPCKGLTPRNRD